jgi:hypothetical protein
MHTILLFSDLYLFRSVYLINAHVLACDKRDLTFSVDYDVNIHIRMTSKKRDTCECGKFIVFQYW